MRLRGLPAALALSLILPAAAWAGRADIVAVEVAMEAGGTYGFDVTVKSDDTGWDKYADKWEVLGPDGQVLGTRVLYHPHETEQPFTRSLGGVTIPPDISSVTIRAHDKVEGYGGREMTVNLPR